MSWEILIDSTKVGVLNKLVQELNGHEDALVYLPNTSGNRTLVESDRDVTIKWKGTTIFFGRLKGADYEEGNLIAKIYDKVYEKMASKDFTGEYVSTSADTILGDICTQAGVTKGSCPATAISVKFVKTLCLEAAMFVAAACNKDFWSSGGTTLNIGDRGTVRGAFVPIAAPKRGVDRATQRNHVWMRGTDSAGNVIWGEAKSAGWTPETDKPVTFIERKASNIVTLNNLAASKLKLLEKESSGVKLPLKLEEGVVIIVGDTITVNQPKLKLSGAYRVWKTTKTPVSVEVEIDVAEAVADQYMLKQESLEELGIYPVAEKKWQGESPSITKASGTSVEDDSTAEGEKAIVRPFGQPSGNMWTGPASKIGAGSFYALFCLRVENVQVGGAVCLTIGVESSAGGGTLTSANLTPNQIGGVWKVFALRVSLQEDWTDVNLFGTFVTGKADVWMDWVGVVPADAPFASTGVTVLSGTQNTSAQDATQNTAAQDATQNTSAQDASQNTSSQTSASSHSLTLNLGLGSEVEIVNTEYRTVRQGTCSELSGAINQCLLIIDIARGPSGGTSHVSIKMTIGVIWDSELDVYISANLSWKRLMIFAPVNANNQTVTIQAFKDGSGSVWLQGGIIVRQFAGHVHAMNNPPHSTGITNPAHATGITNPSHSTGINNPSHPHGTSDPTHLH